MGERLVHKSQPGPFSQLNGGELIMMSIELIEILSIHIGYDLILYRRQT